MRYAQEGQDEEITVFNPKLHKKRRKFHLLVVYLRIGVAKYKGWEENRL
jgi:hypothetical protein